jgi:hypothetical protein
MKAINRDNGHDADSKSLQLGDMVLTAKRAHPTQKTSTHWNRKIHHNTQHGRCFTVAHINDVLEMLP